MTRWFQLVLATAGLLFAGFVAQAQTNCTYKGGYPFQPGGCLLSGDLNAAIAAAMVPPTTLGPGVAATNLGSAGGEISGTWNNLTLVKPLAHAALPVPTLSGLGGVFWSPNTTNEFLTHIDATGRPQHAAIPATAIPALTGDVTKPSGSAVTTLAAGSAAVLNSGTLATGRMPALTGDVTTAAGAVATTIAANAVTNAKAAQMANGTVKCRTTAGTGNPEDCTTVPTAATAALTGDVTKSAGSNATTLAAGSASNLNSGTLAAARLPALTGDVTSSVGSATTSIAALAVTNAKIAASTIDLTAKVTGALPKANGGTASTTGSGAATNLSLGYVVCQSAATGLSTTSATETNLASCTIPANTMGTAGSLRVETTWSMTASTNTKTPRIRYGTAAGITGTSYLVFNITGGALVSARCSSWIASQNSTGAQIGPGSHCVDTVGSAVPDVTSAVDTTAASFINITGQTNGTETITLSFYRVVFFPAGGN